ncbi:hypothetical protein BH10ACI2_BH10ACI2_08450 [soil metagenome]
MDNIHIMKRTFALFVIAVCFTVAAVLGQTSGIVKKDLSPAEIDKIVKKFAANERDFREALKDYVFNRFATVNIIGLGGQVAGTYRRDSFMAINQDGSRFEKVLFAPMATTPPGFVTPEDLEDLGGVTPFAIDPDAVPQYNFSYMGLENVDGLDLYVFDVTPKVIPDPKKSKLRLFIGRIWVEKDDLMIIKSKGKAVPETKENKFPIVETIRLPVDNKYYFPVEARADDELVFGNGTVTRIKMPVKFKDYRVGRSEVRILDDVTDPKPTPTPTPSPTPKKPE